MGRRNGRSILVARDVRDKASQRMEDRSKGVDKQGNSGAEAFSRESLRLFWTNRILPDGRLNLREEMFEGGGTMYRRDLGTLLRGVSTLPEPQ